MLNDDSGNASLTLLQIRVLTDASPDQGQGRPWLRSVACLLLLLSRVTQAQHPHGGLHSPSPAAAMGSPLSSSGSCTHSLGHIHIKT